MGKIIGSSKLKALEQFATSSQADFRFSPLNIMVLMALCLTGLGLHFCVYPNSETMLYPLKVGFCFNAIFTALFC